MGIFANGSAPLVYQWRKDGALLAGQTGAFVSIRNAQPSDAGFYTVVVTNPFGSLSAEFELRLGISLSYFPIPSRTVPQFSDVTFVLNAQSAFSLLYQWRKNGVTIPGATTPVLTLPNVQPADAGGYTVEVAQTNGRLTNPPTPVTGASLVVTTGLPFFSQLPPASQTAEIGSTVTLSPIVLSTTPVTYQWRKDGVAIPGATLTTLTLANIQSAAAGSYVLVATNRDGVTQSRASTVVVIASRYTGTYTGAFDRGDAWALHVGPNGAAVFVGLMSWRNEIVVARNIAVTADGTFAVRGERRAEFENSPLGARFYDGTIVGAINLTTARASGTLTQAGVSFTGELGLGAGGVSAGGAYFEAVPIASNVGEVHAVSAPGGALVLVAVDVNGVRGGRGTMTANGDFSVVKPQYTYSGVISGIGRSAFTGFYAPNGATQRTTLAAWTAPTGVERLANISTRGFAGMGARALVAGFVVGGTASRDMLIRVAGPALAGFGVQGTLENPRLQLYRGGTLLHENDDWEAGGDAAAVIAAGTRQGAFPFTPRSSDAALLVRLEPGNYSAQVSGAGTQSGVALVEVYDAGTDLAEPSRLINLSTRGEVGQGGNVLIVGVVVGGAAPKRCLVRAVGPALLGFGVTEALATPRLQLYRGAQLLRETEGWASAEESLIAEAATKVGAFPLPPGSKDAAVLVYLEPGGYTAQVSGVSGSTGIALVEIYEVP